MSRVSFRVNDEVLYEGTLLGTFVLYLRLGLQVELCVFRPNQ